MAALCLGGEDPVFDDQAQASAILGAIMGRYNAILREIEAGTFEPLVWGLRTAR